METEVFGERILCWYSR